VLSAAIIRIAHDVRHGNSDLITGVPSMLQLLCWSIAATEHAARCRAALW
jgi:hypothetical protein